MPRPKVVIIGLDAAVMSLIEPWVAQGKLPNLASLMKDGSAGLLESVIPPLTPAAWTSFMTGKNPGKHGIYNFMENRKDEYGVVFINGGRRRSETLWKLINDAGMTVGVMNTPFTYPPEKLNGFQISGLDMPGLESEFVHPPELRREIEEKVGPFMMETRYLGSMRTLEDRALVAREVKEADARWSEIALYLLQHHPQDVMMFTFMSIDTLEHHFWSYMDKSHFYHDAEGSLLIGDPLAECYQRLDATVGEIVQHVGPETAVFVVSDHGQAAVSDRTLHLNRLLAQAGLLVYKPRSLAKKLLHQITTPIFEVLNRNLNHIQKARIARFFPKLRDQVGGMVTSFSDIDWSQTKAYSHEAWATPPSVSINLKGARPEGIVDPANYEDVLQAVIKAVQSVKDPRTGQPVVQRVYRRDEIYTGEHVELAPDLMLEWWCDSPSPFGSKPSLREEAHLPPLKIEQPQPMRAAEWSGNHTLMGSLIARGPGLRSGERIDGARLIDLAPTLLALLGIPVPADMDGRVLSEMLDAAHQKWTSTTASGQGSSSHPPAGDGYSDHEAGIVEERLKNLGYLES